MSNQVPEETVSSPKHQAWLRERQQQDPLNPMPIDDVADTVLAYRPKIKTKAAKRRARRDKRAAKSKVKPK